MHCPNWQHESIRILLYCTPKKLDGILKRILIEFTATSFIATQWSSLL